MDFKQMTNIEHEFEDFNKSINQVCFEPDLMNFKTGEIKTICYRIMKVTGLILSLMPLLTFIR